MKLIGLQTTFIDFVFITYTAQKNVEGRLLSHIDKVFKFLL